MDQWRERWRRRGELLSVAAITSLVATIANDEWLPVGVSVGVLCVGLYLVFAAESNWWLPGRRATRRAADAAWMASAFPQMGGTSPDATAVVDELRRIRDELEAIGARLTRQAGDSPVDADDGSP